MILSKIVSAGCAEVIRLDVKPLEMVMVAAQALEEDLKAALQSRDIVHFAELYDKV